MPVSPQSSPTGAWIDEDDEHAVIPIVRGPAKRLRQSIQETCITGAEYQQRVQATLLSARPKWLQSAVAAATALQKTTVPGAVELISPMAVLHQKGSKQSLPSDIIEIRRHARSVCAHARLRVLSVDHHPERALVMVVVRNEGALIFDSQKPGSPPLYSLRSADMRILSARFSADGSHAVVSGNSAKIHLWYFAKDQVRTIPKVAGRKERAWTHLESSPCGQKIALKGDQGYVVVLSAVNHQVLAIVKCNAAVMDFCFSPDGALLFAVGADNVVYIWDCSSYALLKSFADDAGTCCTSISVSHDMSLLAVGGNLGILNFYNLQKILTTPSDTCAPCRVVDNLTTAIDFIRFHPSSELVLCGSSQKSGSLRLIHLPSFQVFPNWPKQTTPLAKISAAAIDPSGSRIFLGNERGELLTYGLCHFDRKA